MGAWGPKLYQDDVAENVRDYYKDQLHRGKSGSEITQELMEQNAYALSDPDDAPVFWFALADTQWTLGRLEDFVKDQTLHHVRDGYDIRRWEMEDPKEAKTRAKVLSELEQRLLSPQPAEKKISQYRLYRCEWKVGDVYAYQFCGQEAKEKGFYKKYIYFVKVEETNWRPGHIVPVVYFYKRIDEELSNIESLKNVEYLPQFFVPEAYVNNPKRKMLYLLTLLNTSSKIIPKDQLTYVGRIDDVKRVINEDLNSYNVSWKRFESYMIDNYIAWNQQ